MPATAGAARHRIDFAALQRSLDRIGRPSPLIYRIFRAGG
jgi:hypothetical protein